MGSEAAGMTEEEKAAMRAEIEAELRAQDCLKILTLKNSKIQLYLLNMQIEIF